MSFSNKATPVGMVKREDNSAMEQEQILANLENFRCEFHPQFKIDALNMNKVTNTITFHCIKCIIEGDGARSEDEKLITIKELLHNCYETFERRKRNYRKSRDGVKDRLLGFLTKEYLGTYDKLLESQYDLVDKKLSGLIDRLSLVRERYREYYRTELETLKEQGSEIKEKINSFYDENNQGEEKPQYNSINEIYDQFNKISRKEELQEFLQELHLDSIQRIEDVTGTDDCKRLIGITESIKAKAKNANENPPDLSNFEGTFYSFSEIEFYLIFLIIFY